MFFVMRYLFTKQPTALQYFTSSNIGVNSDLQTIYWLPFMIAKFFIAVDRTLITYYVSCLGNS